MPRLEPLAHEAIIPARISAAVPTWAIEPGPNTTLGALAACVRTLYIQKASPWENGYVESFNGTLRDEPLDRELFLSLPEARVVLD